MERSILQLGHPTLWTESSPVVDLAEAGRIADDLRDTLFGRGIAAPQIGVARRVLFIRVPDGFCDVLVNPRVVERSRERFQLWDDCFSFPELMVRVDRALRVSVAYQDLHGNPRTVDGEGALSELLQHEIDHLDGILAIERAISPRAFSSRAEWEVRHR